MLDLELNTANLVKTGSMDKVRLSLSGDEDILFHKNGVPAVIELTKDTLWKNILFKKGSRLHMYPNGTVQKGTLARPEDIMVWMQFIPFEANSLIRFYDDGTVKSGRVGNNIGLLHPYGFQIGIGSVTFFRSGAINTCVCKDGLGIGGRTSKPGTMVVFSDFFPSGQVTVRTAVFASDTRWGDYTAAANADVSFYDGTSVSDHGKLLGITTTHDVLGNL